jgi:acetyl-CoA carboxylase biotin carboxyl carrier protein
MTPKHAGTGRPTAAADDRLLDLTRRLAAVIGEHGLTEIEADTTPMAASVTIEAPMVGTFYRASSPTAEPYVREGDLVKEGQILCIIEAMKLMNEIESRAAGRVTKILVDNAQPVEYGQPLFLIEPQG